MRLSFFRALLIQDISFFDAHQSGEWLNRLAADATTVQQAATINLAAFLNSSMSFSACIILCLALSWQLFCVILVTIPLVGLVALWLGKVMERISAAYQASLASGGAMAGETLACIRTVRTFACGEAKQLERYERELDASFALGRRKARIVGAASLATALLAQCALLGSLGLGTWMMLKGTLRPGALSAFLLYAATAAGNVGEISGLFSGMYQALGASQKIFDIVERVPSMPSTLCAAGEGLLAPDTCCGEVRFEDVCFAYAPVLAVPGGSMGEHPRDDLALSSGELCGGTVVGPHQALREVSFAVGAGQMAALVGPSGGGKSTIMALLTRLYDPEGGAVRLDGHDLRRLDPRWLRRQVGVVSQEPVLFSRSIRENITYGCLDAPCQADVESAARRANAHDFIVKLPHGYESPCGERGVRLSGGERQRITIARALLLQPRVLLLDEATSSLDAESEHLVQNALDSLLHQDAGRPTLIVAAHRLSTVQSADQILVISGGRLAEQGTHGELIARQKGLYAQLAWRQRLLEPGASPREV